MSGALLIAASVGEKYDLSFIDISGGIVSDVSGTTTTYRVEFRFNTSGTLDVIRNVQSSTLPAGSYVIPGGRAASLYVRCVQNSGTAFNVGATLSTWHALTSNRSFGLSYTSSGGADSVFYDVTFSLSTDSGGVNIVATANPDGEVGELF